MDNRKRNPSDDSLAEPMWRDAQCTRPEFSAALDTRLRAAIRTAASPTPVDSRRELRGSLWSWAVAAAASIAVFVASALFWRAITQVPGHSVARTMPFEPAKPATDGLDSGTDLAESTAGGIEEWMASTVDDGEWAGLNRDVETAMAAVTGPLPFDLSMVIAATDPVE